MSLPTPLVLLRRRLGRFPDPSPQAPPSESDKGGTGPTTPSPSFEATALLERAAWTLVWLGVLIGGVVLWGSWSSWPVIDVLAPALVLFSLAGVALCWSVRGPRWAVHQGLGMLGALVAVATPEVITLHTRIYYTTDSAALDQVASRVLTHGHNPYTSALTSARLLLHPAANYWTYMIAGGHVSTVSYPAGSFLFYAPAYALGFHHQVVDWMDLYAWLAAAVLVFLLLPSALRWIAALVTLTGIFTAIFAGGGTDAAFLPFAVLAVWRWDRYGRAKPAGIARWLGPVALGLACSIKQTPWFLVPFLVIGIAIETRRDGRAPIPVVLRYLAVVVVTFLAVNVAFIVWSPSAWWHDTLLPFTQPLVADGQGLVSLALHGMTGGVDLDLLSAASFVALVGVVVAYVGWYRYLKGIWLLLLPVVFFFSTRSFSGYMVDLFPIAVVALLSVEPAAAEPVLNRRWGPFSVPRLATGALAVATGVISALALSTAPLRLSSVSASIGPDQQQLLSVVVRVTNTTGSTVHPLFMVNIGSPHPDGFWSAAHGRPVALAPHATKTVVLFPPTPMYLPPWASDYVIDAYTD
ncbi:MAG TPA: hypothetical protein VMB82_05290, partial [Acidimicrobiales bacterium]|nr:hypothetical protein [Acidimicrobiales bacterium]